MKRHWNWMRPGTPACPEGAAARAVVTATPNAIPTEARDTTMRCSSIPRMILPLPIPSVVKESFKNPSTMIDKGHQPKHRCSSRATFLLPRQFSPSRPRCQEAHAQLLFPQVQHSSASAQRPRMRQANYAIRFMFKLQAGTWVHVWLRRTRAVISRYTSSCSKAK